MHLQALQLRNEVEITKDKCILLVEDEPDESLLTRLALKKNAIANPVELATHGQAALARLFDTTKALPMLVLLDLNMPKVDGLEVLKQLRCNARTRRVPVVILTSSDDERDRGAAYDLGCNGYIRKPLDFDQFVEAIRGLGWYWLVLNEAPPLPR